MIYLSYSTINSLLNAPHTWLNKQMGLKTRSTPAFEQGKKIHKIVQESVSGVNPHPLMVDFPLFEEVERHDFDQQMKIDKPFNDKYAIHGYVDLKSPARKAFGDIKSGKPWSIRQMVNHPQFWIYYWALDYPHFTLINLPKEIETWHYTNMQVYTMEYNQSHKKKAEDWIQSGINVIENIKEEVDKEDFNKSKHHCFYEGCTFHN